MTIKTELRIEEISGFNQPCLPAGVYPGKIVLAKKIEPPVRIELTSAVYPSFFSPSYEPFRRIGLRSAVYPSFFYPFL